MTAIALPRRNFGRPHSPNITILLLVAFVVLGSGLGLRDPWPADEPRFALVAKQMVESGDWLFPHRGTELYSDKPPLFMWSQAALYWLTGSLRVAFLLPSLLAGLLTIVLTYDLGRRLWNRQVGLYAAWALLFTVQFTLQMKRAQIDPLLLAWVTLAHYALLRHILKDPDWKMWCLGWFAAGLGVITKGVGVIALFVLIPAMAATCWQRSLTNDWWRNWRFWLGPAALLIAIALWLVPMLAAVRLAPSAEHLAYAEDILFRQTVKRYADSWTHIKPPWYFMGVMVSAWLPLMLAMPWAVVPWKKRILRGDPRVLLLLGSWLLIVVFFSMPSGKRDMYILPALPLACLALAPLLPGMLKRTGPRALLFAFIGALATGLAATGIAMLFGNPGFEQRFLLERGIPTGQWGVAGLVLAMAAPVAVGVVVAVRGRLLLGTLAGLAGMWVVFGTLGAVVLNDSSSSRGLMEAVAQRIGPDAELGLVGWREQQLLMSRSRSVEFGFNRAFEDQLESALTWQAQRPGDRWLLIEGRAIPDELRDGNLIAAGVANRRRWWLLPAGDHGTSAREGSR
ncbi:MAG: glycosyltransferase family 39 protein [Lysobacteraceae bacterium]